MASNQVIILAIDGGGIKGIIPAYFLTQIEQKTGKSCYQLFDIIGGTSTGGIIAAALTTINPGNGQLPFSAANLLNIYQCDGSKIFVAQNADLHAKYYADDGNGNGIEPYLQNTVGDTLLSSAKNAIQALAGSRIIQMFTTGYTVNSTGYDITNPILGQDFGPYLFNWYDAANGTADDYCVWEAARGTSAAPSYFPIAYVGGNRSPRSGASQRWIVDGGTMSNNPAVWALTEALRLGLAQSLSEITIISLGTGVYPGACGAGIHNNKAWDCPDNGDWSITPWMIENMIDLQGYQTEGMLVNIILDAVQLVSANQLTILQQGGLNYYRLEPVIPQSLSSMDNISQENIDNLTAAATSYLSGDGSEIFADIITILEQSNVALKKN